MQGSAYRPLKAFITVCAGILAMLAAVGFLVLSISRSKVDRGAITGTGFLVSIGIGCFLRARRMIADPISSVFRKDPRGLVLYLRSFMDDEETGSTYALPGYLGIRVYKSTAEQIIVDSFKHLGPVIAVGKPGETLPVPGAARFYVSDEHWQTVVRDLMQRAAAVVLRCGISTGLAWEIKEALTQVAPERICMILVPSSGYRKRQQRHYEKVRSAFALNSGVSLPAGSENAKVFVCDQKGSLLGWQPSLGHPLNAYIRQIVDDPVFSPKGMFGFKEEKSLLILLAFLVLLFAAIVVFWMLPSRHF